MNYTNIKTRSLHPLKSVMSKIMFTFLLLTIILAVQTSHGQEKQYTAPSWYFGVGVGGNLNFYRGSTQMLNDSFTPPAVFNNGFGAGLFLAPSIEYYKPGSKFGFMLQAGIDDRRGNFNTTRTACNCPADLQTNLTYVTIEPSLRYMPFNSTFFLFGGPRLAFNQNKSFTYSQKPNPNFPQQVQSPDVVGNLSNIRNTIVSMQIGAGFDIPLSSRSNKTQFVASPFVSYQPYFGQDPRSVETWSVQTIRAGFVLKFGQGRENINTEMSGGDVMFSIETSPNTTVVKSVREVFPIRNYVFFNEGSTDIPNRYQRLSKSQVKDFKEDMVEYDTTTNKLGRSARQLKVYYNVLNILGDRMVKTPNANVKLVGSSQTGIEDATVMAQNIKNYLVDTFNINSSRIAVEGREKPLIPSTQVGGTLELELLRAGDRRVSIESNSPELLMEFQNGKDAPLKPIEIIIQDLHSDDVIFNVQGAKEVLSTWTMKIKSNKGVSTMYGPYTSDKISIARKTIMGNQPAGNFTVTMNGTTKTGTLLSKESSIYLTPFVAPKVQESLRYSIIYEFNDAKAISIYEKYLTEIVTPKIPINGIVTITGHTDIIGDENYNKTLSLARANDVKNILQKSLSASGRTDVTIYVQGDGEDENLAPFNNTYPEERFYNRTVNIDVTTK